VRSARWLLATPLLITVAFFFLYPTAQILARAFTDYQSPEVGGWDNFRWFVDNSSYLRVFARTFFVALAVTVVCLALSYPYVYVLTIAGARARRLMFGALLLPYFSSLTMRNFGWLVILGRHGPVNSVLAWVHLGPLELLGTAKGALIAMCHLQMPVMALPLYVMMRTIDRRLIYAAHSLGANPVATFVRVYVPLSLPGVVAGSLLTFVSSLGLFITPVIVGSPREALLSQLIVNQVEKNLAWGRAGAMAFVLLAVATILIALAAAISRRAPTTAGGHIAAGLRPAALSRRAKLACAGVGATIGGWLLAPMLITIPMSFTGVQSFVFPPRSWSSRWYEPLLSDPTWRDAAVNSIKLATAATVVATGLGTAAAIGLSRSRSRLRGVLAALLFLPLLIPLIVFAIGAYLLYLRWHLVGTFRGLLLAHVVLTAPIVIVLVMANLEALDDRLERASASLGAHRLATFRQITLPLIMPGVLTGALFTFLSSFDETIVSRFLVGPETRTLPVQVFDSLLNEVNPTVAAVSTVNLAVTATVLLIVTLVARLRSRHT
jgi:putative spermidine/putrescine transport system permease protein